jgi:glycine cleavage system transcriptional repressor
MAHLIVTAVGPDRPGLVAALAAIVNGAGGSFADSRMVNLQGHFALLARVDGDGGALDAIGARLVADAKGHGLDVKLHRVDSAAAVSVGVVPYRLKTYSPDQHGIVARVTALLAEHGVNVEELETRLETAPFAGTPLFTVNAVINVPATVPVRKLREALGRLADDFGGDVDVDPA